ncbi:MAG: methyltransferase domain-containing protein [Chloroflexota bacterium]
MLTKWVQEAWWWLVRLGFYLLYHELAWTYDAVSWLVSLGQWRAWQRAAVPWLLETTAAGRRPAVLELAHGPGHLLVILAAAGGRVVGLDLSPEMGRLAQRRLGRAGLAGQVTLLRGRGQELPFANATFDGVLSTFPTEFVLQPATLAAVYRVLRPGGRFVIVPEGHLSGRDPLSRFIEWLYEITGQRGGDFAVSDDHFWPGRSDFWQEIRGRFEAAGFRLQVERVTLPRSGVTVVIAHKP